MELLGSGTLTSQLILADGLSPSASETLVWCGLGHVFVVEVFIEVG